MSAPHLPVLLTECLEAFQPCHLSTFVDGTLGAGGHAAALLQAHQEITQYIGFDQDPQARRLAYANLSADHHRLKLVPRNFRFLDVVLDEMHIEKVDGILLDIGVSSMQLDDAARGFSFMRDGPLDMRMDTDAPLTAAEIVNTWSELDLMRIFRNYGEEPKARWAAQTIAKARQESAITTTLQLADVLRPIFSYKKKGINPLTLIFQALRIAVNDELGALETAVNQAILRLAPGGRLAVITFHSLEDRIVKNAMRDAASDKHSTSGIGGVFLDKEPLVIPITRKPIQASDEEIAQNPRSRSAKLRVVQRK